MQKRWLGALVCALLVFPVGAQARKQGELIYGFDQVWNAALRMVRVDLRLPVTDRDQDAGYLLFDYVDHGKRYAGSIELVRAERDRRPATKAVVQVQGMPAYVEQMLLERLGRKLREEYGEPLQPTKPDEKPPAEKPPAKEPGTGDEAPAEPSTDFSGN
ncbi:MAG: hypothetical protein QM778_04460 [Myxococcales bacterium]